MLAAPASISPPWHTTSSFFIGQLKIISFPTRLLPVWSKPCVVKRQEAELAAHRIGEEKRQKAGRLTEERQRQRQSRFEMRALEQLLMT